MLKQRLITGPLLIVLLLLCVWLDGRLEATPLSGLWSMLLPGEGELAPGAVLFGLCLVAVTLAGWELATIFRGLGVATRSWLMSAAGAGGLSLSYLLGANTPANMVIATLATGMLVLFLVAMFTFSRGQTIAGVPVSIGAVLFAMLYLGLLPGFFLALRQGHSAWWIVGVILVAKCADIGAYFTGKTIGRHKLIPWLSPGKTWEGLAGGVVLGALAGVGFAALSGRLDASHDHVPLWLGLGCGVVFALVGLVGDLTISLFKRGASIKDSSSLLPGLGGVLDVMDSLLLVAPAAFWMLTLLSPGE